MSDYVIEAKNVSCKVGYKYLLKDISWQVKAGPALGGLWDEWFGQDDAFEHYCGISPLYRGHSGGVWRSVRQ